MLSDYLANLALDRAERFMERRHQAIAAGRMIEAEQHLRRSEGWDDIRLWIDGIDTWRKLRSKRRYSRRARLPPAVAITGPTGPKVSY